MNDVIMIDHFDLSQCIEVICHHCHLNCTFHLSDSM